MVQFLWWKCDSEQFYKYFLPERSILYTQLAGLRFCESGKYIHSISVSEGSGEFQLNFKLLFKVQVDLLLSLRYVFLEMFYIDP